MAARVARLGAECDYETEEEARARHRATAGRPAAERPAVPGWAPLPPDHEPLLDPRGAHFRVSEFAVLDDGRRLRLHDERGFTLGGNVDPWQGLTPAGLESDVLATVLPDDAEETGEDHPWDWLASLLRAHGVEVPPDDLRQLPYDVEFTDRLRARLARG